MAAGLNSFLSACHSKLVPPCSVTRPQRLSLRMNVLLSFHRYCQHTEWVYGATCGLILSSLICNCNISCRFGTCSPNIFMQISGANSCVHLYQCDWQGVNIDYMRMSLWSFCDVTLTGTWGNLVQLSPGFSWRLRWKKGEEGTWVKSKMRWAWKEKKKIFKWPKKKKNLHLIFFHVPSTWTPNINSILPIQIKVLKNEVKWN